MKKYTKADVDAVYAMADDAKKRAFFSMQRARQLRAGADKIKRDYNQQRKKK